MIRAFKALGLLLLLALTACTQVRVRRYAEILDPMVGSGKKEELDKVLGNPAYCQKESIFEKCEYRTASGRNGPTPEVFSRTRTMPDVSPYDYFDVIHVFYDAERVVKEWQPVVVKP